MGDVVVEEFGGFAPAGPHLRKEGRVAWSSLSPVDQAKLDALFAARRPVNANMGYRLTREGPNGPETVEATVDQVPEALVKSVATTIIK